MFSLLFARAVEPLLRVLWSAVQQAFVPHFGAAMSLPSPAQDTSPNTSGYSYDTASTRAAETFEPAALDTGRVEADWLEVLRQDVDRQVLAHSRTLDVDFAKVMGSSAPRTSSPLLSRSKDGKALMAVRQKEMKENGNKEAKPREKANVAVEKRKEASEEAIERRTSSSSEGELPPLKAKVSPKGKVPTLKGPPKAIPKALPAAKAEQPHVKAKATPKGKIPSLKAKEKEMLNLPSAAKAKGKHPLEHDPQLQPTPQRTAAKSREQSCVALLSLLMFALEPHMPSECLEHEMECIQAAYAIQRYQTLGVPYEAAGEMADNAAKRANHIGLKKFQLQHQELWSSTNVVFQKCGIAQMLIATKVVFHKCGITQMWISTNEDFHKWEITPMSTCAKDPSNLFGYRRLAYETDIQYDEFMPSEESEVDSNKAAKVPASSTTTTQTPAKGPTLKTATLLPSSVTPEFLIAALSTTKPTTTPVRTPRNSTTTIVSLTAVRSAKGPSASSSAKVPTKVVKASSAKGTLAKAMPRPMNSIVPLPLVSCSKLRKPSASQSSDSSPSKGVAERTRKKTNANALHS